MLLIVLSWIYIAFTSLNWGFVFRKLLKINDCHVTIHLILGLFLYTIITSGAAFFIRIHIEYYVVILILNLILTFIFKKDIAQYLNTALYTFKAFKIQYKILFGLVFLLALAQSATAPYLIDNESYYIQTIKWINEFGYVKGLANLHVFLGQNSSWHTLQAGFNFPFISNRFNDINGYVFVLLGLLFVEKLHKNETKQDFFLGLVLVFSLFFMQFVNTPSPDLIVFLITPYVIYEFILNYKNISINRFKILLSLVLFLCFIKVTMLVLSVLIAILFFINYKTLKFESLRYTIICCIILSMFLLKNYIISGYLLYPTSAFNVLDVDWKLPKQLLQLYKTGTYQSGMNNTDVTHLNAFETFSYWIKIPKLHGFFNKVYVILLIIFPLFILKIKNRKPLLIIYMLALLQFAIVWLNSPQYRFFFVFIVVLSLQIFISVFKSQKIGLIFIYVSLALSAITLFIPINLNAFTSNNFAMSLSNFKLNSLVIPAKNSRTTTTFTKENNSGFEFNSPGDDVFFWATGDGDLPCVNKQHIEYIKTYYHFIPKLRGNGLNDGFISYKLENSEN
jgi:hypothetical protein